MANILDQKPHVATEKDCQAPWSGVKGGKRFRCYLCGHKFEAGDTFRFVYGQGKTINFLVCDKCDGEDVFERWLEHHRIAYEKYWWLTDY